MRRLSFPRLNPRTQLAILTGVLLALVGVVFAVEERAAALERATSAHEAALAARLSSAQPPSGLAAGRVPRRAVRTLDRALGDVASARAGSVRLWNRDGELVYSGGRRLTRSSAAISQALGGGLRGRVDSVRVADAGRGGQARDQLATIMPLRATPAGPAVGAFEVRRPWESVADRADFPSWGGLLPIVAALTLAWVGMLVAGSLAMRGRAGGAAPLKEAQLDPLTDLPNRTTFRDLLDRALIAGKRGPGLVAVMLMDVDRFKEINDTLGHYNGDLLLKRIGPRLRTVLRDQDTVARLGGDEFAILLPGLPDEAAVATAAERIVPDLRGAVRAGRAGPRG